MPNRINSKGAGSIWEYASADLSRTSADSSASHCSASRHSTQAVFDGLSSRQGEFSKRGEDVPRLSFHHESLAQPSSFTPSHASDSLRAPSSRDEHRSIEKVATQLSHFASNSSTIRPSRRAATASTERRPSLANIETLITQDLSKLTTRPDSGFLAGGSFSSRSSGRAPFSHVGAQQQVSKMSTAHVLSSVARPDQTPDSSRNARARLRSSDELRSAFSQLRASRSKPAAVASKSQLGLPDQVFAVISNSVSPSHRVTAQEQARERINRSVGLELYARMYAAGVPSRIGGSYAAMYYGAPRVPQDLDIDLPDKTAVDSLRSLVTSLPGQSVILGNGDRIELTKFVYSIDTRREKRDLFKDFGGDSVLGALTRANFERLSKRLGKEDAEELLSQFDELDDVEKNTVGGDLDYRYVGNDGEEKTGRFQIDAQYKGNTTFDGSDELNTPENDRATNPDIVHPMDLVSSYLSRIIHNPSQAERKGDADQVRGIVNKIVHTSFGARHQNIDAELANWVMPASYHQYRQKLHEVMERA